MTKLFISCLHTYTCIFGIHQIHYHNCLSFILAWLFVVLVAARFLQPMAAFAREIQSYKYYIEDSEGGNRELMDRKVYEEKKKAPAR